MKLNLKRPVVFFDLETTGTSILHDRIVEISIIRIMPQGQEETFTFRCNPEMPIPPESTAVHGISDDDVRNEPTFRQIAHRVMDIMAGADIAGFNSIKFDIPLLSEELARANVDVDLHKRRFIDVQNIFHKMERRTLAAAYQFYCNKDLENAHTAEADTRATYEVLMAQLDKYPELENDVDVLADFSMINKNVDFAGRIIYNDKGQEVFNFGKYKGQLVEDALRTDPGYLGWILEKDFASDTKRILMRIRQRMQ